jgi:hypothetical protein
VYRGGLHPETKIGLGCSTSKLISSGWESAILAVSFTVSPEIEAGLLLLDMGSSGVGYRIVVLVGVELTWVGGKYGVASGSPQAVENERHPTSKKRIRKFLEDFMVLGLTQ